MAPLTIPKTFKFKLIFPLPISVATIVENANIEMVAETLISNTINLASNLEELFTPILEFQSPITKKKKRDHESVRHFQDQWATKLPWAKSI
jgi:hypothetical protein